VRVVRFLASALLMVFGAGVIAIGAVLWWTDGHLFDTAQVVETTDDVLARDDVQALLVQTITDRVMAYVPDAALRPQVEAIVTQVLADPRTEAFINSSVSRAHGILVGKQVAQVPIELDELATEVRRQLVTAEPELEPLVPDPSTILDFDVVDRSDLPTAWRFAERFHEAALAVLLVGSGLVTLGLLLGPARWGLLAVGGIAFALVGLASGMALTTALRLLEDRVTDPIARAATKDIFDVFFAGLEQLAVIMAIVGVLVALFGIGLRLIRPEYSRRHDEVLLSGWRERV
jgi:hypothetical protein